MMVENKFENPVRKRAAEVESPDRRLIDEMTSRKRTEEELLADRERLRTMNYELALDEELHRRRIAQYLHDNIGQCLSLTQMKLGEIRRKAPASELSDDLKELIRLLRSAADETYTLTMQLSPLILYDLGLSNALQWLTELIAQTHRMEYEFNDVDSHHLPMDTGIIVFRAVEELLNNVVKHAKASNIRVRVWTVDRFQGISVEDNGAGFEVAELDRSGMEYKRFGLLCIRERLNKIGGLMEMHSEQAKGTQVTLWIPVDEQSGQ